MRPLSFILPGLLLVGAACQRTDRGSSAPLVSVVPAAPTAPDAHLRETRWVLRRIASLPVADSTVGGQQPYLQISDAGTAEGQGSCNRFRGTLQPATNDGELQFSPLATTRMACPTLATETLFTKALQSTRAYRIQGDTLWLYGNAERTGTALARLETAPAR
ncbi:MAG: META domain-containing protein [Janthinobacterium lividum]